MTLKKRFTTFFFWGGCWAFSSWVVGSPLASVVVLDWPLIGLCKGEGRELEAERPVEVRGMLFVRRSEVTNRFVPWAFALAQPRIRSVRWGWLVAMPRHVSRKAKRWQEKLVGKKSLSWSW